MAIVVKSKEKTDLFAPLGEEQFNNFMKSLNGSDGINLWRRKSFEKGLAAQTPNNHDEDFKYVDFRGLSLAGLQTQSVSWLPRLDGNPATMLAAGIDNINRLPEEYYIAGVEHDPSERIVFESLAETSTKQPAKLMELLEFFATHFSERKFVRFAHAYLSQGAFLQVQPNTEESNPRQIYTRLTGEQRLSSFATVAEIGANSRASLVWDIDSETRATGFLNGTLEVIVRSGSHLNLLLTQHLANRLGSTMTVRVYLERDSMLEMATISSGGHVSQTEIDLKFAGRGAQALVNGVYLGREKENFNLLTHQDHQVGNTNSDLFYIGTLAGASSSNYLGKITIARDAQRSDAYQKNRNLILNKGCTVNSSPKLEIGANDVRCTHGATTARVSDLEMFYLRSRGIDYLTAKVLLADGFIAQVTPRIKADLLQNGFARRLEALLYRWGTSEEGGA